MMEVHQHINKCYLNSKIHLLGQISLLKPKMRLETFKKKNKIFKFLCIYNFTMIVLYLAY
ncbi:hypothetical protein E1A91_D04G155200v1 [Gossypium mustelinum]|uniref:Uncharacterized protein n=1 Tax=Gossypium mustelinum TaxID=34275 RepID=A0A5D2VEB5_GOSMU|nr:hypothetical protein E1A91_D04G155200v1 [Gossypium mustelinum]